MFSYESICVLAITFSTFLHIKSTSAFANLESELPPIGTFANVYLVSNTIVIIQPIF